MTAVEDAATHIIFVERLLFLPLQLLDVISQLHSWKEHLSVPFPLEMR